MSGPITIVYYECPHGHVLMGLTGRDRSVTEQYVKFLTAYEIRKGVVNPWCERCHAASTTWRLVTRTLPDEAALQQFLKEQVTSRAAHTKAPLPSQEDILLETILHILQDEK